MKPLSLYKKMFLVLSLILTACAPQAPAVMTVVVTATSSTAAKPNTPTVVPTTAAAPAATNTLVVQTQQAGGGQPTSQPATGAQSTAAPAAAAVCPTQDFIDVSTYKPKTGWPTPRLKVTCDTSTMLVETNGIPNFDVIIKPTTEVSYKLSIPLSPKKAAQATDAKLGYVAVAVNGVPIWAPSESPQDGSADPILEKLMEICNGHAVPFHFHGRPDCLFKTVINQTSLVVAYALDGFPIMAPYACEDAACTKIKKVKSSWQTVNANVRNVWERYNYTAGSGDLDKCNGMTGVDGKYRYYATDTFPYTIACFTGTTIMNPQEIDRMANAGAAAGGGQQPGGQQPGGQQPGGGGQQPGGGGQQPPATRNPPPTQQRP